VAAKDEVEDLLISWECRVRSLQLQIKTFLLNFCSRKQLTQLPLPRNMKRWLMSGLGNEE
jgi:hypothetical protein